MTEDSERCQALMWETSKIATWALYSGLFCRTEKRALRRRLLALTGKPLSYSHELFLTELGLRLRKLRIERGWTLADMLTVNGYHLTHWKRLEKGKGISIKTLLRACDVFQVRTEILIAGAGWAETDPQTPDAVQQDTVPFHSETANQTHSHPQKTARPRQVRKRSQSSPVN